VTLRSDLETLLDAVAPEGVVLYRSGETAVYYVLVQDRRTGQPFDRVGIGETVEEAASTCVQRYERATPPERITYPEAESPESG
jgi:hypothetical protein